MVGECGALVGCGAVAVECGGSAFALVACWTLVECGAVVVETGGGAFVLVACWMLQVFMPRGCEVYIQFFLGVNMVMKRRTHKRN